MCACEGTDILASGNLISTATYIVHIYDHMLNDVLVPLNHGV